MRVDFYQLSQDPAEIALAQIAPKVLESGARLLVVSESEDLRERIDRALWSARSDSFVPHGRDSEPHAERQPVLISDRLEPLNAPANGATCLALADGQWRESETPFERVFFFFDADTLQHAREMWVAMRSREGVEHNFWRQENGRWVKAA
ncbi:DNA polymerase III subunit chi [Novosphingobium sp. 9]|uniref:DNA polymerase III subunit chi n=1 Tax=Novosphingobium sp. 9 TaxID=2025349 RepID=UPI0021B5E162|nr:DNA polymerase III subunit chi [Novosphingobium sp. 9]